MTRLRKISQWLCLLLFILLFLHARYPYETNLQAELFLQASPLVGLAAMLAGRAWIPSAILGLALLLLALPLGRFFCGWICPLGTIIDGSDHLMSRRQTASHSFSSFSYRSWKYFILTAILIMAVFSLQPAWFFDPIVILFRVFTTALYPALVWLLNGIFNAGFDLGVFEEPWYGLYGWAQKWLLPITQPFFQQSILILILFFGILLLGRLSRRFWCRNLCPLGALFGLFSKFRLVQRRVDASCTQCGVCRQVCRMNAVEDDYTRTNTTECIECAECMSRCKPRSIRYGWTLHPGASDIDFSRRRFIQAAATGILTLTAVKTAARNRDQSGRVIRPPGALREDRFLDRCVRCQACVRICSTTGGCLQPAALESGWEGVWSPIAVTRSGYCEYNCHLCSRLCPSGAIQKITLEEKQKIRMGMAYFDKSRCIPWYRQEDCLVCEEHCPLPDKAIKFDIRDARTLDGGTRSVKFPYIREDLCIGCGICETKCPVIGSAGVFITAAGEQRITSQRL